MPSAIDAAAFLSGLVPGTGTGQIALPKRPAPALARTNRINHTSLLAVHFLQEHTIPGARVFNNRCPQTDALQELAPQLACRHLQKIGDYLHFRLSDPDIPFARPGATRTALDALKMQPTDIPRSFLTFRHYDLPLEDRACVGAGCHRGVLCEAALGYFWFWRLPRLFALGQFLIRYLYVYLVVRDVNFYYVTVF